MSYSGKVLVACVKLWVLPEHCKKEKRKEEEEGKRRKNSIIKAYTFNPSTWEAKVGRSLSRHSELQASQGYRVRPCLKRRMGNGRL